MRVSNHLDGDCFGTGGGGEGRDFGWHRLSARASMGPATTSIEYTTSPPAVCTSAAGGIISAGQPFAGGAAGPVTGVGECICGAMTNPAEAIAAAAKARVGTAFGRLVLTDRLRRVLGISEYIAGVRR
ncbi:hypothetical protein Asp14428_77740 [Actinoplanes sp. NBRC 14428]|nr:hypothetical protein Asp14428_77740 [Actinoplanes sp. NBRC 14428]